MLARALRRALTAALAGLRRLRAGWRDRRRRRLAMTPLIGAVAMLCMGVAVLIADPGSGVARVGAAVCLLASAGWAYQMVLALWGRDIDQDGQQ